MLGPSMGARTRLLKLGAQLAPPGGHSTRRTNGCLGAAFDCQGHAILLRGSGNVALRDSPC